MIFQEKSVILASGSPRRKELLESIGLSLSIQKPDIHEEMKEGETPVQYALRNSKEKVEAVLSRNSGSKLAIIAADTIVLNPEGKVLEKPNDKNHAREMLNSLSGKTHTVYTGFSIAQANCETHSQIVETKVTFAELAEDFLERYLDSEEPYDKAGGYGVQGLGIGCVSHLDGSYTNVMGLPISHVVKALKEKFSF